MAFEPHCTGLSGVLCGFLFSVPAVLLFCFRSQSAAGRPVLGGLAGGLHRNTPCHAAQHPAGTDRSPTGPTHFTLRPQPVSVNVRRKLQLYTQTWR